ncbi:MAG: SWIM zinc finger family protein, partial [Planctomycetes bacterium]|nr:SWIM zinc finger family protein [Planctomycetota bacterium]
MAKPVSATDPLAAWRAHFPVETQRRGDATGRDGRVEIQTHDGAFVSAGVRAKGSFHEVEIDLRSQRVGGCSCTCSAFETSGTCEHVWAVLHVVLGGVAGGASGSPSSSSIGAWLTGLQRLERAAESGPAPDASEPESRVDYVLVLDESASGTLLETRRARALARGGFGKSSPFDLLAPRKGMLLNPEDRRIAALLRGADSTLVPGSQRARGESRYLLDAEQTLALLPQLCATGRLFWSRRETSSTRPLVLDDGPPFKPCLRLAASEEGRTLELDAHLERAGERIARAELRGVLAGDLVVLDERIVRARLERGRTWFLLHVQSPLPPFPRQEAPAVLLELARRELDVEPGPGMEAWIEARRPVPHLLLSAPKRVEGLASRVASWSEVAGLVEFDYGVARVLATDKKPLLPTGRGVLRRYFEVENALLAQALALGLSAR